MLNSPKGRQVEQVAIESTTAVRRKTLSSAYVRLVRFCHNTVLDLCELTPLVSQHWAKQPIFHASPADSARIRKALGESPEDWECALGADLLGIVVPRVLLVSSLRYCPSCLDQGWHAALFQHVGVGACPLHKQPLRLGCPRCAHPIDTSPSAIVENHHYCGRCGQALGSFDVDRDEELHIPVCFADLHEAMRFPKARGEVIANSFAMQPNADYVVDDRAMRVGVALHRIWPARPTGLARCFPRQLSTGPLESGDGAECIHQRTWDATARALKEISECLAENQCYLRVPWDLTVSTVGGRRINARAWLPSAALWRTAIILGAQKYLDPDHYGPLPVLRAHPYQYWMPDVAEAAAQVAEAQVYGLFVVNLLDLRRYTLLTQLPWEALPAPVKFSPAWRMRETQNSWELDMRLRVSFALVERLVRRYRKRLLHISPSEGQPQQFTSEPE